MMSFGLLFSIIFHAFSMSVKKMYFTKLRSSSSGADTTEIVLAFKTFDGSGSDPVEGRSLGLDEAEDIAPRAGLEPISGDRSS